MRQKEPTLEVTNLKQQLGRNIYECSSHSQISQKLDLYMVNICGKSRPEQLINIIVEK